LESRKEKIFENGKSLKGEIKYYEQVSNDEKSRCNEKLKKEKNQKKKENTEGLDKNKTRLTEVEVTEEKSEYEELKKDLIAYCEFEQNKSNKSLNTNKEKLRIINKKLMKPADNESKKRRKKI
jgi:hypothetical protein